MKNDIRILVVDDEPVMSNLLRRILEKEGYEVTLAENGREALGILRKSDFELVLSDVKMPEMNGFELLKAVKTEKPQIGMIMMTGFGDSFTVKDALMLGADEYITKPFKAHEISLVIERTTWRRNCTSTNISDESEGSHNQNLT